MSRLPEKQSQKHRRAEPAKIENGDLKDLKKEEKADTDEGDIEVQENLTSKFNIDDDECGKKVLISVLVSHAVLKTNRGRSILELFATVARLQFPRITVRTRLKTWPSLRPGTSNSNTGGGTQAQKGEHVGEETDYLYATATDAKLCYRYHS